MSSGAFVEFVWAPWPWCTPPHPSCSRSCCSPWSLASRHLSVRCPRQNWQRGFRGSSDWKLFLDQILTRWGKVWSGERCEIVWSLWSRFFCFYLPYCTSRIGDVIRLWWSRLKKLNSAIAHMEVRNSFTSFKCWQQVLNWGNPVWGHVPTWDPLTLNYASKGFMLQH